MTLGPANKMNKSDMDHFQAEAMKESYHFLLCFVDCGGFMLRWQSHMEKTR